MVLNVRELLSFFCYATLSFGSHFLPVLKIYLLGLKTLLIQLFSRPFRLPVMPRQDGKVAIVTGGSRGIGYEVVRHMAGLGAHIIIAGVDEREGLAAARIIREEHKWANVEFQTLDLASLRSVRRFVQVFEARGLPLHILVNNAAVMLVPQGRTEDGFERHLGVNYLGHFLLTRLLLGRLRDCGRKCGSCSRVVTVSSSVHRVGEIRLDDLNGGGRSYSAHAAYCQSKLALLVFAAQLQRRLECEGSLVSVCAVDPGVVDTALYHHLWQPLRLLQGAVAWLLFRTPAEGAATVLYCALEEVERVGGGYWANGRKEMTSTLTFDLQLQQSLWDTSCRLVGVAQD